MKQSLLKLKSATGKLYRRFIKIKGAPREIALGFALGLMVGMTPFFGMHIILSIVLASLLGWSKISAIVGVNITNFATAPLIYPITLFVGNKLAGFSNNVQWRNSMSIENFWLMLKQSPMIILDLCVGGLVLGIPLAIIGYYLSFRAITLYRERLGKRVRLALRRKARRAKKGVETQTEEEEFDSDDIDLLPEADREEARRHLSVRPNGKKEKG